MVRTGSFLVRAADLIIAAIVAYSCVLFVNWSGAWTSDVASEVWRVLLMDAILVLLFFGFWSLSFFSCVLLKDPFYTPERALAIPTSIIIGAAAVSLLNILGITKDNSSYIHLIIFLSIIIPSEYFLEETLLGKGKKKISLIIKNATLSVFWLSLTSIWFLLISGRLAMYGLVDLPSWLAEAAEYLLTNSLYWLEKYA